MRQRAPAVRARHQCRQPSGRPQQKRGSPGYGYQAGDPYGSFLPSPVPIDRADDEQRLRAVVVVTRGTPKGTKRSGQEYTQPLLVMSGAEYGTVGFGELVERVSSALRGSRPGVRLEVHRPDGHIEVVFDDDNTLQGAGA